MMVTRTKKIFVGGLSAPTTLEDVKNYFEQFGPTRLTELGLSDDLTEPGLSDCLTELGLSDDLTEPGLSDGLTDLGLSDGLTELGLSDCLTELGLSDRSDRTRSLRPL
ncbi:hypothetical protein M8J77_006347 [Diaphorina citri]|nr:hypothetical protein M8J77_006347 [Diaphorina citri]